MNLKKCDNGHYYNPALFDNCPVCSSSDKTLPVGGDMPMGMPPVPPMMPPMPMGDPGMANLGRTEPLVSVGLNVGGETMPLTGAATNYNPFNAGAAPEEGATMPLNYQGNADDKAIAKDYIDPVVGWLVSVGGAQKGQDYRLHDGYNNIGRGQGMDVTIKGDSQISRERQAQVIYDAHSRSFFFVAGEGRNVLYVNGQLALKGNAIPLKAYDVINMGDTTLVFIPMCGDKFDWSDAE